MTSDNEDIRTEARRHPAIDVWQTNQQAFGLVRRFGEDLSAR